MKRPRIHFEKGPIGWLQRYALFSYDHPIALFFGILATIIFFGALGGALGFRLTESSNEWEIKTNKHVKQNAAINEALDELSEETRQFPYSVEVDELQIFTTYEAKDEGRNMFTEDNLNSQKTVENLIMANEYPNLCLLDYNVTGNQQILCTPPLSVLNFFFEYNRTHPAFGDWIVDNDPEASIAAGINAINLNPFIAAFFLDKQYNQTEGFFQTVLTRSRFELGLPIDFAEFRAGREALDRGATIPEYTNSKTDEEDQLDEVYDEYLEGLEERLFDLLDMEAPKPLTTEYMDFGELGNLEVLFANAELQVREFTNVVMMDFMWAGMSILSVWIYMLIHLGSVFLSLVGILEIFLSFPVALFFYKPVFQIDFFSEMNLLVIFILLGIGADDIFVFTDAYKQSGSVPGIDPSLQGRLMYSASRASKAVFVTSFTTMAAFFATAVSPLMPMQAFGIFAALCIVFLFAINVFLMPPTLVLYAGYTPYLTKWVCPCCIPERRPEWVTTYCPCCSCCHVDIDETFFLPMAEAPPQKKGPHGEQGGYPNQEMEMTSAADRDPSAPLPEPGIEGTQNQGPIMIKRQSSLADANLHELRSIEKFFYGPFFIFLQRAKWAILVIGVVLFCTGIGFITTFQTPDEAEEWFPDDHVYNRFFDYTDPQKTPFRDSLEDNVAEVFLVWGLRGMDPSSRNRWIGDDFGDLEYDEEFDPTPPENQLFLLGVCPQVRDAPCNADACAEDYLIRIDRDSDDEFQQKCWIEDFNEWLQSERDTELPLDRDQFIPEIANYLAIESKFVEYGEDIGYSNRTGELRFVMFSFDSTFRPPASSSKTRDVIDEWEDFIDMLNDQARNQGLTGIDRGFESGRDAWLWPSTSDALISGAISGLLLVFVLAFVVLNVASGNVMISVIAVLTIAGIVATVMGIGIRGIMDWDLGTAESITIVILIGFSMDYTLHLSDAYMESPHSNREDRTRDAMTHLGISVTAGAFTTLISGLFLWATILIFFQKFAFNVTATVFTSFLFSIFFFPSLCLTIGPQGDWGNWSTMYKYLRRKKDDFWAN